MKMEQAQVIIRKASPIHLANHSPMFWKKEAQPESRPTGQNALPGPSTIAELAEALRNPLPPKPARLPYRNALEAFAAYKPLTMEMVRDILAKERAARDVILKEYTERTGQAVDYCDECDMGVVEEEIEEKYGTRVEAMPCEACDGLGVVTI